MPMIEHHADRTALSRLHQEARESLQRLRLGGPFYVLLWLLSGVASELWEHARWPFLLVALAFVVLAVLRLCLPHLPAEADEGRVRRRLNTVWVLMLSNAGLWGASAGWLLMTTPSDSARTVVAVSSFALATAFVRSFPMRLWQAYCALGALYLPTLVAMTLNGSRIELVGVSFLFLVYTSLALRRSYIEYRQRLDLENELRRQRDLYEQQSRRDGLTGLANRRRFSAVLEGWAAQARKDGSGLVLLVLDLDRFKDINDQYGHAAGDDCLRAFAQQLQQAFPAADELVARLGGEEFGVLLRRCALEDAVRRAEAFRRDAAAHIDTPVPGEPRSTVSIGVAVLDTQRHAEPDDLYREADAALYRAKDHGRNRVYVATPTEGGRTA